MYTQTLDFVLGCLTVESLICLYVGCGMFGAGCLVLPDELLIRLTVDLLRCWCKLKNFCFA